jgi:uncharacterized protein (DUF924 family)
MENYQPEQVLDFWFPDSGHQNDPATHAAFWDQRMQGGMDAAIKARFAGLTEAAATGKLDHWAKTPRGRLALLIALDQFPRSLWRDTPAAFAQDIKATRLALEGIDNGDFDCLAPWEQTFFHIAVSHCEGPDHLERLDRLAAVVNRINDRLPEPIRGFGELFTAQHERVRKIIARFGRHPHRNAVLGRLSTTEEADYIAAGDFPHQRKVKKDPAAS